MKLYQFITSIFLLNFISVKFYFIIINFTLMLEYYHRNKFIKNKVYEKYFEMLLISHKSFNNYLNNFYLIKYFVKKYSFIEHYYEDFKSDFWNMIYEKFLLTIFESFNEKNNNNKLQLLNKFMSNLDNNKTNNNNSALDIDQLINDLNLQINENNMRIDD